MNKRKLEIFVDTHLQLCEACVSDAGTIYRAIDLHRDDLRRWLPFVDGLHSVAEEKNFGSMCRSARVTQLYFQNSFRRCFLRTCWICIYRYGQS